MRSIPKALKSGIKWTAATLLVLLLVAVLVVELISWNFLKPVISERVEEATGRSLTIDGDLSLSLLPRPRFSANELSLSNPDWAQADKMIELEHFSVAPSITALLTGQVALADLELASLKVSLEKSEQHGPNWVFKAPTSEEKQSAKQEPVPVIPIEGLKITDTQINYRGVNSAPSLSLSIPQARLTDDGEQMDAVATLLLRERSFDFQIEGDSLYRLAEQDERFGTDLALTSGDSELEASFELPAEQPFATVSGSANLTLKDAGNWSEWLGGPAADFGGIDFGLVFAREEGRWQFRQIEADLAPGRITGQADLVTGKEQLQISAKLHSNEVDLARLIEALPKSSETEKSEAFAIPVFPLIEAELEFSVDQILFNDIQFENLNSRLSLSDHKLELETFTLGDGKKAGAAQLEAFGSLTSAPESIEGQASLDFRNFSPTTLGLTGLPESLAGGQFEFALTQVERTENLKLATLVERSQLEQAQFEYREQNFATQLNARLSLTEERKPQLSIDGEFRQRPVKGQFSGDPLPELFAESSSYEIEGQVSTGQTVGRVETSIESIWPLDQLSAQLEFSGPNEEDLQPWIDTKIPTLPEFDLSGRLQRDQTLWSLNELRIQVGETRMSGDASFDNAQRPMLRADLSGERINLIPFLGQGGDKSGESDADSSTSSTDKTESSMLSALRALDARLNLQTQQLILSEQIELSNFAAEAKLEQGVLNVEPLNFALAEGSVSSRINLDASVEPASGLLRAELEGIELEQLVDSYTPMEEKLGMLSGSIRLEATETRAEALRADLPLAELGRLSLSESELRFRDQEAETDLTLNFTTQNLADGQQTLAITGAGQYDGSPFDMDFTGDPVLNLRDPERSYQLKLDAEIADTQVNLDGSLQRPLKLKGLDLQTVISGSNPQDINRFLGTPLPSLPRYSVAGTLTLQQQRWQLEDLSGAVGTSDVRGRVAIDMGAAPPHLSGDLRSESLDMGDLRGLIGADTESEDPFLLPDQAILGDDLQKITADVSYKGKSVRVRKIPLTKLEIKFLLDDGQMQLTPVSFGVGDGSVDFALEIDSAQETPKGTMSVEVQRVDLNKALSEWNLAGDSVGIVAGRGKFWVEGRSVADLFASADGGMVMLMTGGNLDALLVELAGLDVYQSFLSWIRDREPVPINCAYLDLKSRQGLLTLDTAVIDSEDTSFTAAGQVDFNGERLDVTIQAHPKDPSFLVGRTPLHLGGTFKSPEPSLEMQELGGRLAASAVLQAVATPMAALLPLLDYGAGDDSGYCEGIVSRTREATQEERE